MFSFLRDRRRRKLLDEPFPPHWDAVLRRNVGHYPLLPPPARGRMQDCVRVLVAEKQWEAVGGLVTVPDEMKLTIAAQASLLLLGPNDYGYFARVKSIVVYPTQFVTPVAEDGWEDDGLGDRVLDGQAVYRGPVILAWDQVLPEARDPAAGYSVVLHEFAHQLDFLDDEGNGTPPLPDAAARERWKRVMTAAFEFHRGEVGVGVPEPFFSEQAADDELEFFADATEAFFCAPAALRDEEPDVYALFADYYGLDPATWFEPLPGERPD